MVEYKRKLVFQDAGFYLSINCFLKEVFMSLLLSGIGFRSYLDPESVLYPVLSSRNDSSSIDSKCSTSIMLKAAYLQAMQAISFLAQTIVTYATFYAFHVWMFKN